MNGKQAARLVEEYLGSWMNQDLERFLSTLSDDVVIVECDSTAYRGVDQACQWFTDWHAGPVNGRVADWEILRVLFDEANGAATAERDFSRVCHGEASSFLGASVVTLDEARITRICEYRMDEALPLPSLERNE
jgi:ketosteroid isomerase-like protein